MRLRDSRGGLSTRHPTIYNMVYYAREESMTKVAKLFANGRSQAVRLPREFRFDGAEVFIPRDPASGDVILSRKPGGWAEFFTLLKEVDVPADFMADRRDPPAEDRGPL